MTPERWSSLQRLFQEALRRFDTEREDWLAAVTAGDDALLEEVHALLDRDARPDACVERAIAAEAARLLAEYGSDDDAGRSGE